MYEETGIEFVSTPNLVWKRDIVLEGKKGPLLSKEYYYSFGKADWNIVQDYFTNDEKKDFLEYKWWSLEEIRKTNEPLTIPKDKLEYLMINLINGKSSLDYPLEINF